MMKKRLLSILVCAALLIGTVFGASVSTAAAILYGDVDGNGAIESIDAALIQRDLVGLAKLNEEEKQRGTISGEERLSILDVTLIQRYLAKMITRFPVQGSEIAKVKDLIPIHFTDNKKWGTVYAYLYNGTTGEALAEWPGVALTDPTLTSANLNEYTLEVDVSRCDRVIFNDANRRQTIETPVTKASYGFIVSDKNGSKYDTDVYTGGAYQAGKIDTIKMDYPGYAEGEKKTVWVYLPDGYDPADTDKKYSVLYMDDGQVMLGTLPNDDWRCDKNVRSLMNNGGDGVIIVGISSLEGERDREMRPYLGEPIWDSDYNGGIPETMTKEEMLEAYKEYCDGETFADFTVNTVIPYVEAHYNVNSVRGFTGSSGGGLMAFYMGVEYAEYYDYVGVMSPSLNVYDASVWDEYLSTKDFSGKVPRMYIFCGNNQKDAIEKDLYTYSAEAESWLLAHGYPSDRVRTVINNDTKHMHKYWGLYLPELFSWGMRL